MFKIGYISEKEDDGLMTSLEMDLLSVPQNKDFRLFLKDLIYKDYAILFVSETMYVKHQKIIDSYDSSFELSIIILAKINEYGHLGRKRMSKLIEEAIGIKVEEE